MDIKDTTLLNEIISPEGVEERVIEEMTFRITMTGGGKFRLYLPISKNHVDASRIFDDKDTAMKELGGSMLMLGGLMHSPKETMDMLLKGFKSRMDKDKPLK